MSPLQTSFLNTYGVPAFREPYVQYYPSRRTSVYLDGYVTSDYGDGEPAFDGGDRVYTALYLNSTMGEAPLGDLRVGYGYYDLTSVRARFNWSTHIDVLVERPVNTLLTPEKGLPPYECSGYSALPGLVLQGCQVSGSAHADNLGIYSDGKRSYDYSVRVRITDAGGDRVDVQVPIGLFKDTILDQVTPSPVVEFRNADLGHYFMTMNAAEIAGIAAGAAGPGWSQTGYSFKAWTSLFLNHQGMPGVADAAAVCRFYGTPGIGPNSHFFTLNGAECQAVMRDPGWMREGGTFVLLPPDPDGTCPDGTQAVYRTYNDRFAFNDSNHRFTTDPAVYASMISAGWLPEGVVMCAPR
jgi:hypothetical protein